MKPKFLLFIMLLSFGVLNAQDTIKTLVISECRLDDTRESYVEITNMGLDTINLSQFELGKIGAWTTPWDPGEDTWFMLPDKKLAPGASFLVAGVYDWTPRQWLKDPDHYNKSLNKQEMWTLADVQLHFPEAPSGNDPTDSVTPYFHVIETWNGRDCLYLRHHISETDSAVIDQVNGLFTDADGTNPDAGRNDVAGVSQATNECTLVRRFSVKQGNLDFESARGQDLAESEWIPVPHQLGHWEVAGNLRTLFWTAHNHGDYNLDESTLESSTIDVNLTDSILTVPWGVRNDDSIMSEFVKKPGIAWHYTYAPSFADSAYVSCRTGDKLTIYVCGNDLDMEVFDIQVSPPTTDANIVVPKYTKNSDGFYDGSVPFCQVTDGAPGMDSILEIPFACRVDTLFKYLEKAPNASWEIEWVDGVTRADLKEGDILKVTAENNSIKEYYVKPNDYRPSHNAELSSITWPDIPEFYKGIFGWKGDTIPNFTASGHDYKVQVPYDVEGIPALVAKATDMNAKVEVTRAKTLTGSAADKTVTFTVTAEDDTTIIEYKVQFEKERALTDIQPWIAEPFFSQIIWQEQWANGFMEICNPGTEALDMSNYMLYFGPLDNPSSAIQAVSATTDYAGRYAKYIPGFKWQDQTNWEIQPSIAIQDLNVNPIVQPGDVFVLGDIRGTGQSGYPWWASEQCDIDFGNNPWGETVDNWTALQRWSDNLHFFLFKITNDSIKEGTKPANDPNDFELVETWGDPGTTAPVIGGLTIQQINSFVRKPQYYKGTTGLSESFGTDAATSEWIMTDRAYYDAKGIGWPDDILLVATGIGSHFMNEVTVYKSTVSSLSYIVSSGYSMDEEIRGVVTGATVTTFLNKVIKADAGQTLTLKSGTSGAVLAADAALTNGDTLVVLSADGMNTSKYLLEVGNGLSTDAVLTSTQYTITVDGSTGTIGGFDYGTDLKTVVSNVTVPDGAAMNVVDANDAYVPQVVLNFDTIYVNVQVNDQIYFEVIAEDGETTILYQLMPNSDNTLALVTSSVLQVDQENSLIELIPDGMTVSGLMQNLIPSPGATVKLNDKYGLERTIGNVVKDDKIVVTAADGLTTKVYYLVMLGDIPQYLAYVVSDVYNVNEQEHKISGNINALTSVTDFIANLTPAIGATIKVVDSQGNERTGELSEGDKLVVTSGDESTTVEYAIDLVTTVVDGNTSAINIYPNPTTGKVFISGLEKGYRIHVYNMVGERLIERIAVQTYESLSLENQPFGVYFIVISNNENVINRYKLIVK